MKKTMDEVGFAFLLVLFALLIFGATAVVIFSGLSSHGSIVSMFSNSNTALSRAEDGLAVGQARLLNGINFTNLNLQANGGWNVTITYTAPTGGVPGILQSTATNGRYSRTVAISVAMTQVTGPNPALNKAIFTQGNISFVNGDINLNGNDVFTNGTLGISNNVDIISGGGSLSAAGNIDNKGDVFDGALSPNQQPLPFPELDFDSLAAQTGVVVTTPSGLSQAIDDMLASGGPSGGGTIVVQVNSSSVDINKTISVAAGKKLNLVFVNSSTYTGDFNVHLIGTGGKTITGEINLLAEGGTFHFNNINFNSSGVIYTNRTVEQLNTDAYGVKMDNVNNFQVGGIISRDQIKFNNGDLTINETNFANRWQFVNNLWKPISSTPNFTNWREL